MNNINKMINLIKLFYNILISPFKFPKIEFYIGEVKIGTPYFLPRRWVKLSKTEALNKTYEYLEKNKDKILDCNLLYNYNLNSYKYVPKIIGFDFVDLGWKTKWSDTDYRYEWSPTISFVFFKYQIALILIESDYYWEGFLYYRYNTKDLKTKEERITKCIKDYSLTYSNIINDKRSDKINEYERILKNKYLKYIINENS
jgi:hypothetical protein